MKRILLAVLTLAIVILGGRAIVRGLASPETKIRWRLDGMVAGYNAGEPGDTVMPLTKDWKHEGFPLTRDMIRGGLIREAFQGPDRVERRALLDEESVEIEFAESDDRATLDFEIAFETRKQEQWQTNWTAHIQADLRRTDGDWFIFASRHTDLAGTPLSR